MKLKIFDVIELIDGNKATILNDKEDLYKVEVVDYNGIRKSIKYISEKDIQRVIISK